MKTESASGLSVTIENPVRILMVHNTYQQYGGEDSVFLAEKQLLLDAGYDVSTLVQSNSSIGGLTDRISAGLLTTYNPNGFRLMRAAIAQHRPSLVHVHNFFPRLSASIFDACAEAAVPVVWTLHNFRVACANGFLFRDGLPCEKCLGSSSIHGVVRRCYRDSFFGTAAVAGMIGYHKFAGTWHKKVNRFIALTEFSRSKFVAAKIPITKIVVKPNFVADPGRPKIDGRSGALFVGRLSLEKGVDTLIEAWRGLEIPLTVIGDGPAASHLRESGSQNPAIKFTGQLSRVEVQNKMAESQIVIVPSKWFENFPMTVAESLAAGTPVIASRIGSLAELVQDGVNSRHFEVGNSQDLRRVVVDTFADTDHLAKMQKNARLSYEANLSPDRNLMILSAIYREVIAEADRSRGCGLAKP